MANMNQELIDLLREIRPSYGDAGSRDVGTARRQKQIDRAIELLSASKPAAPAQVTRDACQIDNFSGRVCQHGTRSCVADHAAPAQSAHPDDLAVDQFAVSMKEKLAQARAKGRGGWQQCDPTEFSIMLREHVEKGDPRDVANFCMFLWCLGQPISDAALPMGKRATPAAVVLDDERAALIPDRWMLVKKERIDAIKAAININLEESYRGRGLYEERTLIRNNHELETAIDAVKDELREMAECDPDALVQARAASPQPVEQTTNPEQK